MPRDVMGCYNGMKHQYEVEGSKDDTVISKCYKCRHIGTETRREFVERLMVLPLI